MVGFVAHVGDVEAAGFAQGLGDGDHLLRRGVHAGRVVEAGGEAGGALVQRLGEAGAHALGFLVGGGALGVSPHGFDAQRHVADQGDGVHGGGLAGETLGVFGEAAEGPP